MSRQRASGIGQSVQARLRSKAEREGRPYQELLQLYGIERILNRLAESKHRDGLVLKGALLLRMWLGVDSRPTRDIDLLGPEGTDEGAVRRILVDILETDVEDDGLEFDADSVVVRRIRSDSPVLGLRAKLDGYIGRSHLRFQIDVGLGDIAVPEPEEVQFEGLLDLPVASLKAYTVYTMVAEKLEAMAYLGEDTSRMKDFYDLLILPRQLPFDGESLKAAMRATFDRRGSSIRDALSVLGEESELRAKDNLWRTFLRKAHLFEAGSLPDVLDAIRAFIEPPAEAAVGRQPFAMVWKPGGPWRSGSRD